VSSLLSCSFLCACVLCGFVFLALLCFCISMILRFRIAFLWSHVFSP
jgi:hypothetical protein